MLSEEVNLGMRNAKGFAVQWTKVKPYEPVKDKDGKFVYASKKQEMKGTVTALEGRLNDIKQWKLEKY